MKWLIVCLTTYAIAAVLNVAAFIFQGDWHRITIAGLFILIGLWQHLGYQLRKQIDDHQCPPRVTTDQLFAVRDREWDRRGGAQ